MIISEQLAIARQYHQAGNITDAQSIYDEILETEPENDQVLYLKSLILYHSGKVNESIILLNKAISISPLPEYYNLLGNSYSVKKDFTNAINSYNKSLELDLNNFMAHYALGLLYEQNNALNEAIKSLLKTIESKPDFADAYFTLGRAYFKKQESLKSAQMLLKAGKLDPKYIKPNSSLGNIYKSII